MDCSLPGSSVHGLLQARILEWVASSFSRGSSRPRDQTQVSYIAGRLFTDWSSREVPFINLVRTLIANKSPYSQSYGFSSSHVGMWELDHKEGWAQKNWCFQSVVLEKTHESPLDHEKIKPVNTKEIKLEYSLKRMMLKLQYFGHVMWWVNSLEKTLILGKIEGKRRRGHRGWHG